MFLNRNSLQTCLGSPNPEINWGNLENALLKRPDYNLITILLTSGTYFFLITVFLTTISFPVLVSNWGAVSWATIAGCTGAGTGAEAAESYSFTTDVLFPKEWASACFPPAAPVFPSTAPPIATLAPVPCPAVAPAYAPPAVRPTERRVINWEVFQYKFRHNAWTRRTKKWC